MISSANLSYALCLMHCLIMQSSITCFTRRMTSRSTVVSSFFFFTQKKRFGSLRSPRHGPFCFLLFSCSLEIWCATFDWVIESDMTSPTKRWNFGFFTRPFFPTFLTFVAVRQGHDLKKRFDEPTASAARQGKSQTFSRIITFNPFENRKASPNFDLSDLMTLTLNHVGVTMKWPNWPSSAKARVGGW